MTAAGGTLTALVGLLTLRLTVDGSYQRYVQGGMRPWLLIAGVALLLLGLVTLIRALRAEPETTATHDHGVGAGWLLLAPVATLLLVAPPSLGSYGVDRAPPIRVTAGRTALPPLDTSGGPVPMTLLEYTERSFDNEGDSLEGATVELTGFVADSGSGEFRLARYQIACCAADAAAAVVNVVGAASLPERDQWVTVTGSFVEGGDTPAIAATALKEVAPPEDPYE